MTSVPITGSHAPPPRSAGPGDSLLRMYRNPLRQVFSASTWRAAGYLASYLIVSGALFALALAALVLAVAAGFTLAALPLVIAAAYAVHGCASVLRLALRQVYGGPVRAWSAPAPVTGLWARTKRAWRGRTWREAGLLLGLWPLLLALATAALAIWLTLLAGVALPLWYRAPAGLCVGDCGGTIRGIAFGYFPDGSPGPGGRGFSADTLPRTLLVAAGCAILFLLFSYVLVAAARLHGRVALALLRPAADPLARARIVLAGPGPLGPLRSPGPLGSAGRPGPGRPARPGGSGGSGSPGHRAGARPGRRDGPLVVRIASWSARHRKTAVLGWLAMVIVVFIAGHMAGNSNVQQYDPGQSGQAEQTLQRLHINGPPPAESVLIQARPGQPGLAASPQLRQAVRQVTAVLHRLPSSTAAAIRSPLVPGNGSLISADGRSVLVTFNVTGANEDQAVLPALHAVAAVQASHPGLVIAEAGDASADRVANAQVSHDFRQAEATSLPVTLILLIAVFGALIAAGIPLLLAATAVITAISLTSVVGQWLPTGQSTAEVVLILGMAVGIDYSLFYLRREREERAKGAGTAAALRITAATSGRAIVVSGLTVMVGLAGLFLTGYSVFTGIAIGTIAVVGVTVIGSLTLLPALLSLLGSWADRGRIPFLGRRRTAARPSRLWTALVRRVVRRPAAWGSIAAIGLLALAAPALGLRLGNPPDGGFPASLPVVQTLNRIQQAFPEAPSPAQVVVTGPDLSGPAVRQAVTALRRDTSAHGALRPPVTAAYAAGGRALLINVPLAGNGTNGTSDAALRTLRDRVLPATVGRVPGLSYAVTGNTANNYDDITDLHSRTVLVLAVVAVLAFCLLLVAFRSLAIPLVSVGLNLLSVGAAYGLITVIFQDGRLHSQLGYTGYGAIVPWIPLFMFVFLFGLSMDYHVFILSRIRELRSRGTKNAVVHGIASSAGVVTSAAVIMVAVFSILATLSLIPLKMLGIGLGAAVLIDATVVRGILVPAALALLGERTWYLPRWLSWLPGPLLADSEPGLAEAGQASPRLAGPGQAGTLSSVPAGQASTRSAG